MGMPREPNHFLIDAAPSLLEACRETLGAFQYIAAGRQPAMAPEDYCKMLEQVMGRAEGPSPGRG